MICPMVRLLDDRRRWANEATRVPRRAPLQTCARDATTRPGRREAHKLLGPGEALLSSQSQEAVMSGFKHILVPTDFGEPAQRALDFAITLASKFDSDITLLH